MVFDWVGTRAEHLGSQTVHSTIWLVMLPVAVPSTQVVPWLVGDAPAGPAELEDLRLTAPEAVVACGTHLHVTRAYEPWFPIMDDAAGITESQLIADSEDAGFGWGLLTPEVRRVTVAGAWPSVAWTATNSSWRGPPTRPCRWMRR